MEWLKKTSYDIVVTFISSLVLMGFSFIVMIIISRDLGASDLGLYRMILTLYNVIMLFATAAVPAAVIKFVAENEGDAGKINQIISASMIISALIGAGCLITLYLLSSYLEFFFHMPGLGDSLQLLSLVFPFTLVAAVLFGYLNGLRMMRKAAEAVIIQSFFLVFFSYLFLRLSLGIEGVIFALILSNIAYFLFLFAYSYRHLQFTFHGVREVSGKIAAFGTPIIFVNIIGQLTTQLDALFVGYYLTAADLGYYGIAVSLSQFCNIIPNSIQKITYPVTSKLWRINDTRSIDMMVNLSLKTSMISLAGIGLFIAFFGEFFISHIFGDDFSTVMIPLMILLVGTIIRGGLIIPIGSSMCGIGRPSIDIIPTIIVFFATIALNITIIPLLGLSGAAITTTTAFIIGTAVGLYYINKYMCSSIEWRWFFFCALFTLFLYVIHEVGSQVYNSPILGAGCLLVFLSGIYAFFLRDEDKIMIKTLYIQVISGKNED